MNKKNTLVCAPRLPEFDRESGSKRIYDHLQTLLLDDWSINFVAQSFAGTDFRYKESLEQQGVAVHLGSIKKVEQLLCNTQLDLAILAFWRVAEIYLPLIRRLSPTTKIIIDSIDLHFLRKSRQIFTQSNSDSEFRKIEPEFAQEIAREINIYAAADAVLTVSSKEAEWLKDLTANRLPVYCVPDGERLPPSELAFRERRGILFVGNFWHQPNVQAVDYLCREIIPRLSKELTNNHPVYIVGHALNEVAEKFANVPASVNLVGWVPSLLPYLHTARATVAPLFYGAGTKRKIIQSLLVGTPVITTTIGIEGLKLRNEKDVLVADNAVEFANALERLLEDEELWNQIAVQGRNRLLRYHSQESAQRLLRRAIAEVLTGHSVRKKSDYQPPESTKGAESKSSNAFSGWLENLKLNGEKLKVLILGVYIADEPNNIESIITSLTEVENLEVKQKWIAIGKTKYSKNVQVVTIKRIDKLRPKFELINELLVNESIEQFDYIALFDDDIGLPEKFIERLIALQEKLDFVIAQPARTDDSYIDLPIVRQQQGILARQTLFVEIGPVVVFHRTIYDLVFPFDTTSSMGWGYSNIWAHRVTEKKLKMGIIDALPVSHTLRKPVSLYKWDKANAERAELLRKNPHLTYEKCFTVTDVFGVTRKRIESQQFSSVQTEPLISVIINTRNNAGQLKRCLQSFRTQNLPRHTFEIIVIDDGSSDGTSKICSEFSTEYQMKYLHQKFSGVETALSLGIWTSRALLLLFWDDKISVATEDLLIWHIKAHHRHPNFNLAVRQQSLNLIFDGKTLKSGKLFFSKNSLFGLSCKRSFLMWNGIFSNSETQKKSGKLNIEERLTKKGITIFYED